MYLFIHSFILVWEPNVSFCLSPPPKKKNVLYVIVTWEYPWHIIRNGVELHCGSKVLEMRLVHGYPRAQIFCIFKTPGNKKKQTPMFSTILKAL